MTAGEYSRRAIKALERLMEQAGAENAAAFRRQLAEVAAETPDERTIRRWLRDQSATPFWAAIAAAELGGASLDEVTGLKGEASLWARMEQLEKELLDLRRTVVQHAEMWSRAMGTSPSAQDNSPPA
jgi:hypothetical protein